MNKTYLTIVLAMGLAFVSPMGVFAAEKNGDDNKGSVSKSKDSGESAKDRGDDKKGYGKGGRRDDDLCKENPNACKPKPISR